VIVLDASAAIELILNTDASSLVVDRIASPDETLHAPHLVGVEVLQVVRRYVASGAVEVNDAEAALENFAALDIARYAHEPLAPRVWELRENLTAYDAVYVALAEVLDAPLLTFDQRIADAPRHRAVVNVLG
jgi:predicted nucleic acid-binding protein